MNEPPKAARRAHVGHWSRLPEPRRRPPLDLLFALSVFAGLGAAATLHRAILFPAVPAVFVAACLAARIHIPVARSRDLDLLENPDDPNVCLVEIAIVRDGEFVGADRGIAWFDDDRLLFSGHRTSFALGGQDVLPQAQWNVFRGEGSGLLSLPMDAIPLRLPSGHAYVQLRPLSRRGAAAVQQAGTLVRRRADFRLHPLPTRGERQLPPLEP